MEAWLKFQIEEVKKNTQQKPIKEPSVCAEDSIYPADATEGCSSKVPAIEETPKIIRKIHKRQVSSASAKMFAIADDIFDDLKSV